MVDMVDLEAPSKAQNLLSQSHITELRELAVQEEDDHLLISGRVRSFYHKQLAQETVRQAASGRQVVNRVAVD